MNSHVHRLLITLFCSIFLFGGVTLSWNNDNFIDNTFWTEYDTLSTQNAKNAFLISALYGDGTVGSDRTAYTRNRNGVGCNPAQITVQSIGNYAQAGINSIPTSPAANKIYLLTGGAYVFNQRIRWFANCNAIISRSNNTSLHSNLELNLNENESILYVGAGNNVILDNFKIDGANNGHGGTHTRNNYGVTTYRGQSNLTFHKIDVFNNKVGGMGLRMRYYISLHDVNIYNNIGYGINVGRETNNLVLDNVHIFNNTANGIELSAGNGYQIVNNSLIHNNGGYGIYATTHKIVLNNVMSFNNSQGIYSLGTADDIIFNNMAFFNNASYNTTISAQTAMSRYYGNFIRFGAGISNYYTPQGGFVKGNGNLQNIGFSTGRLSYFGLVGCANVIDISAGGDSFFDGNCAKKGVLNRTPTSYILDKTFGYNVQKNVAPVYFQGTTLSYFDIPYNTGRYIGQTTNTVPIKEGFFESSYVNGFEGKSWTSISLVPGKAYKQTLKYANYSSATLTNQQLPTLQGILLNLQTGQEVEKTVYIKPFKTKPGNRIVQ